MEEAWVIKRLKREAPNTEKAIKNDSENSKVIKVRIRKNKPDSIVSTLFSQKDVHRFVTEFVSSWIRGDIVIRFPTAAELSKKNPLAISFPTDPSINEELKIKEHYIELLLVCAGVKQVPAEEQEKAITEVFRLLLMFRSANRIEGKIFSNDLEKRLAIVEEKIQSLSKLTEQITGFLFKEKKLPQ
jgi:hypothetical protein